MPKIEAPNYIIRNEYIDVKIDVSDICIEGWTCYISLNINVGTTRVRLYDITLTGPTQPLVLSLDVPDLGEIETKATLELVVEAAQGPNRILRKTTKEVVYTPHVATSQT